ncbi:MAG: M48 family metallopeptidase, partial [Planctomycetota bacterium]
IRSRILLGVMGSILVALGALMGLTIIGGEEGAILGAAGAIAVWLILMVVTFVGGEQIVLLGAGARPVKKEDVPHLFNIVEEMTIASGLGRMPKIYIVDDDQPNAFATGRKPENACVTVTAGLVRRLSRDELQGVVAHEIGHIKNLDIRFMTTASVMLGSIVLLSDLFRRSLWFGGARRRQVKANGQAQVVLLVLTLVAAVVAPLLANLLYLACSRKREYLADASAARFTRYPPGLASALEKMTKVQGGRDSVPRALVPMYIVNPLQKAAAAGLFSTHPPTAKRIAILRNMAGGAGWMDYENAYRKVMGGSETCLDGQTLRGHEAVPVRLPTAEEAKTTEDTIHEVTDLLDTLASFLLIPCVCGVRIKVPGAFGEDSIGCPRCGRNHPVPRAQAAVQDGVVEADSNLRYKRRKPGWESFQCTCGKIHQLSPGLQVKVLTCKKCKRRIELEQA